MLTHRTIAKGVFLRALERRVSTGTPLTREERLATVETAKAVGMSLSDVASALSDAMCLARPVSRS